MDITPASTSVIIIDDDTVLIGWNSVSYEFSEDSGFATVCTEIIEGDVARPVAVIYSILDGTAQSNSDSVDDDNLNLINTHMYHIGQDDFLVPFSNMEFIFQPETARLQPHCSNISIRDDNILESDESFSVTLSSSDSAVVTDPSTTTVTIINDDSKFHN